MKGYQRKISLSEKIYLVGEDMAPPFCIQMVVQYNGEIKAKSLEEAVCKASEENPGSRLCVKNNKWIDSYITPKVSYFKESEWNTVINSRLNPYEGRSTEICFSSGRIIFRALHSVMDARGLTEWVKDIFRALRGEKVLGSYSSLCDNDLLEENKQQEYQDNFEMIYSSPTGKADFKEKGNSFESRRVTLNHRVIGLIPKIIQSVSYYLNDKVRFMIPVDLRTDSSDIKSTANLTYPIFVNSTPSSSWKNIQSKIFRLLQKKEYYKVGQFDSWSQFLPKSILKYFFKKLTQKQYKKNKYILTGIISNIGRIDYQDYFYKSIQIETVFFLPVNIPIIPFSLVVAENPLHTEITISMSKRLSSDGRIEKLLDEIKENLTPVSLNDVNQIFYGEIVDYPRDMTIDQLFMKCAKIYFNRKSLKLGEEELTYLDLDLKSNQMANWLVSLNVKEQDKVVIIFEHSIETIISIFGILKVGAYFVPIDPQTPEKRFELLINETQPKIILTNLADFKKTISVSSFTFIDVSNKCNSYNIYKNNWNLKKFSPDNIVYMIYTSGSTGNPKGVSVKHQSLVNYIDWAQKVYLGDDILSFSLHSSLAFDLTMTSIFLPLLSGRKLEIFGSNSLSGLNIKKIVQNPNINFLKCTPSHLKVIKDINVEVNGLKVLVVGGEDLKSELAFKISEKYGHKLKIINEYGPTEATIGCVYHVYNHEYDKKVSVPIGKPIQNTFLKIDRKKLKAQREGELLIGGDCLAKGYENNKQKNFEKFIYEEDKRFYRSGDIVKITNFNNYLDYLGRVDEQIKINGYRIELGEIEYHISKIKGVKQALVFHYNDQEYSRGHICAYVIQSEQLNLDQVTSYLKEYLPKYMIPTNYFIVDRFPFTVNGKIDKEKLPKPSKEKFNKKDHIIKGPSDNSIYNQISFLWSDVLNTFGKIDPNESFFDLGGSSIELLSFIGQLKDQILSDIDEDILIEDFTPMIDDLTLNNIFKIISKYRKTL